MRETERTVSAEHAPPHSINAEEAVLGGLLLKSGAWSRIGDLQPRDFYRPDHRTIFAAMAELAVKGVPFDAVILGDRLEHGNRLHDCGGLAYLGTLVRDTPGVANIEAYASAVRGHALRRDLQAFASSTARAAADGAGDTSALMGRVQEQLLQLQVRSRTGKGLVSTQDLAADFIDDLDSRRTASRGLAIGLSDFDELTHGLEPGDLVVIAARPGMGKTAIAVSIAAHVAQTQAVAVFSAEMPARQLMRRCVALLGNVSQGKLRRAEKLTDEDWNAITPAVTTLASRHLWIDDTAAPALTHIRSECLSLKARAGLGLVMVDYVQLVQGAGANRYEQLRDVAYGCKALAKDLSVPVIVLAQLNRGVEARDERRPRVSDLRDSGAIEEAADIIGLLYSEGYYHPEFQMPEALECRIEKHRNGERGLCLWRFDGAVSRIAVLDTGDRSQYRHLLAASRKGNHDDL